MSTCPTAGRYETTDAHSHWRTEWRGKDDFRAGVHPPRNEGPPVPQCRRDCAWVVALRPGPGCTQSQPHLAGRIDELIASGEDFALESTLSGRAHAHILKRAKEAGYRITLHFVWIPSAKVSLARVRQRVKKGGHNVPTADIMRRYDRIMRNLVELYLPLADLWWVWSSEELRFAALANSDTHAISDVAAFLAKP